MLRHLKRYDEAEPLLRTGIGRDAEHPGPATRASLWKRKAYVAGLLLLRSKLSEAERAYRHVVQESRLIRGPKHKATLNWLSSLGYVLMAEHKHEEAEQVLREAVALDRETLGPRHPTTLSALDNLAHLLDHQGRKDEAAAVLQPALVSIREVFGPDHQITLRTMRILGYLLQEKGRLAEAEPVASRLFGIAATHAWGADHAETVATARLLDAIVKKRDKLRPPPQGLSDGTSSCAGRGRPAVRFRTMTAWAGKPDVSGPSRASLVTPTRDGMANVRAAGFAAHSLVIHHDTSPYQKTIEESENYFVGLSRGLADELYREDARR